MEAIKKKIWLSVFFFALVGTIMAGEKPVLLTQNMLDKAKGVFEVKKDYTASNAVLHLPKQLKLVFDGGKIDNAELVGDHPFWKFAGQSLFLGKTFVFPAFGT